MNLYEHLCCFALRQVVGEGAESAVRMLGEYFTDRGQALHRALQRSNEKAWQALEIALAGEGLFSWFNKADDRAIREQMKRFIAAVPMPPEMSNRPRVRNLILAELRDARKRNLLEGKVQAEAVAQEVSAFARYSSPQDVLAAEKRLQLTMAHALKQAGYDYLAWLLGQPANTGDSLVIAAARFYFRLEVERDERLAHTLQLSALEGIAAAQQSSFAGLDQALASNQERMTQALDEMTTQLIAAVQQVGDQVAATGQQLGAQIQEVKALQSQVLDLIQKLDMKNQPLKAGHSLSIQNDRERVLVKEMLRQFRGLSTQQQNAHPDLMNDLGKLQVAAGDFAGARETFVHAAAVAPSDTIRAEAHHNAYRAALEQNEFEQALREMLQASAIDPGRFSPFPMDKYEPVKILGAGGFGVTFLCRHKLSRGQVAVKSIFADELELEVGKVVQEAHTLDQLKHQSIVGLRDCGYADPQQKRPYLVMEYFPGVTLEEYVQQNGPLSFDAVLPMAIQIADALKAAHAEKVLHRDVKPANILVRQEGKGFDIRLIDFGLAMKQERLGNSLSTLRQSKTIMGSSIAGTLGYAAPEQMGRLPGARVGPQADIYGFGKTLTYALFGITEPTLQHYRRLPEAFAELLGKCMSHAPEDRPRNFAEVLTELKTCDAPDVLPVRQVIREEVPVLEEVQPAYFVPPKTRQEQSGRGRRRQIDEDDDDEYDDDRPRKRLPRGKVDTTTRMIHALLAFLFGAVGIHKFVQGNTGAGVVRILVTCTCVGFYAMLFIGWIEAFIYLTKNNEEYHELYYREMKGWF